MESKQPRPSNPQLLSRYTNARDQDAFAELVRRFGPMVLGVSRRLLSFHEDADDATQLVFAELARRAGTIEDPEAIGGWLHTVTVRVAHRLRAQRPNTRPLVGEPVDPRLNIDDVSRRGELEILSEELDSLPATWREPLLLRYFGGLSNEDAAQQLGTTVSALEGRVKRGKNSLRVRLLRRGIGVAAVLALIEPASASSVDADYWEAVTDAAGQLASDPAALTFLPPEPTMFGTSILTFKTACVAGAAAVILTMLGGNSDSQRSDPGLPQISTTALANEPITEDLAVEVESNKKAAKHASDSYSDDAAATDQETSDQTSSHFLEELGLRVRSLGEGATQFANTKYRGGLEVVSVQAGSSAAQTKVRIGDVIVGLSSFETIDLQHAEYVGKTVKENNVEKLRFYMLRDGETLFSDFQLARKTETRRAEVDREPSKLPTAQLRNVREIFDAEGQAPESLHESMSIEQALRCDIDFQFVDTPLNEMLAFLANAYDISIDIDERSLEARDVAPESTFTLVTSGRKLHNALTIILGEKIGGLDYIVRDNRLIITTQERAARAVTQKVYSLPNAKLAMDFGMALAQHGLQSPRGAVGWKTPELQQAGVPKEFQTGAYTVIGDDIDVGDVNILVTQSDRGHEAFEKFLTTYLEAVGPKQAEKATGLGDEREEEVAAARENGAIEKQVVPTGSIQLGPNEFSIKLSAIPKVVRGQLTVNELAEKFIKEANEYVAAPPINRPNGPAFRLVRIDQNDNAIVHCVDGEPGHSALETCFGRFLLKVFDYHTIRVRYAVTYGEAAAQGFISNDPSRESASETPDWVVRTLTGTDGESTARPLPGSDNPDPEMRVKSSILHRLATDAESDPEFLKRVNEAYEFVTPSATTAEAKPQRDNSDTPE